MQHIDFVKCPTTVFQCSSNLQSMGWHEHLIQRGRAAAFVQGRWRALGDSIEDRGMRLQAIHTARGLVNEVYSQQILGPGVECALAFLMEALRVFAVGYVGKQ
ncbi:unnamed protein product [Prorocentrum cordatum]|uniref:Uncharacterized protein n=1 Tax=Prorocentrum cordatum TaxID=2364126 RepID=A0ABN9T7L9_9DINO|nr:unnamed protein product [Polarella glacialis]